MGRNNKYQSTIGQNHSRRLGGIITAGACVPIILQSRLQKVKALVLIVKFRHFIGSRVRIYSLGDMFRPQYFYFGLYSK